MTHEAEVSRRTGVTSPIKTGRRKGDQLDECFLRLISTNTHSYSTCHIDRTRGIKNAKAPFGVHPRECVEFTYQFDAVDKATPLLLTD
jgi:hypothetical protein